MGLFSNNSDQKAKAATGKRLTGITRYFELLGRDISRYLIANLITLLAWMPFAIGVLISWLSSSLPVLLIVCVITGPLAGIATSCMYDASFRSLRDVQGKAFANYWRAWKQNWKQSVIPGIIFALILGSYFFMTMLFLFSEEAPGIAVLIFFLISAWLVLIFFGLYFMQISLFEQRALQRCMACLLFFGKNVIRCLLVGLLQLIYWALMLLFVPYTIILFPIFGFWFIQFTMCFLLYIPMDRMFLIEKRIGEAFPDQATYYEEDQDWINRRRSEKP